MEKNEICIVGLGYVGITLAGAFLTKGFRVHGVEIQDNIRLLLNNGKIHINEPGLEKIIKISVEKKDLIIHKEIPNDSKIVIICVGTPFDKVKNRPALDHLEGAVNSLKDKISKDTLVIVRSTVPVGTTRDMVVNNLKTYINEPKVVFAPERTIQGKAVEELLSLPQVIGTSNEDHFVEASKLFEKLGVETIPVNSLESSELVKLACNSHTDLIYSFGNELASVASCFGLDVYEVINAANFNYPRPDICRPGYVGGSCLTKDPYHLMYSANQNDYHPKLIQTARNLNEHLPEVMLEQIEKKLTRNWKDLKIIISGLAYKGIPETDDLRGSAIWELIDLLRSKGVQKIYGHDFVINQSKIKEMELIPVSSLEKEMGNSDVTIILNNHRNYQNLDISKILPLIDNDMVLFDVWGVWKGKINWEKSNENYMGVGYGG